MNCNYCDEEATKRDNIYGPPMVYCCDDYECQIQAAWDLWESSQESA